MKTKILAHHTFDSVSLDGVSHLFAYSKAQSPRSIVLAIEKENNQVGGEITTAPGVTRQKLGPSDQMIRFRKG